METFMNANFIATDSQSRPDSSELTQRLLREFDLLAIVAHELRAPLTVIELAAHLSGSPHTTDTQRVQGQQRIKRQVKFMSKIINDLLDMSYFKSGLLTIRPEPIRLEKIADAAIDIVSPFIDAKQQIFTINRNDQCVTLFADPSRVTQVMVNLLMNATKFTPTGGRIELTLRGGSHYSGFIVKDSGEGIASEDLGKLFEMYSQLKPRNDDPRSGLGLGLALSRTMVELHGGSIRVTSAGPGLGTRFIVRIPNEGPEPRSVSPPMAGIPRCGDSQPMHDPTENL
jgi:signal transduction histidine kinase